MIRAVYNNGEGEGQERVDYVMVSEERVVMTLKRHGDFLAVSGRIVDSLLGRPESSIPIFQTQDILTGAYYASEVIADHLSDLADALEMAAAHATGRQDASAAEDLSDFDPVG